MENTGRMEKADAEGEEVAPTATHAGLARAAEAFEAGDFKRARRLLRAVPEGELAPHDLALRDRIRRGVRLDPAIPIVGGVLLLIWGLVLWSTSLQ